MLKSAWWFFMSMVVTALAAGPCLGEVDAVTKPKDDLKLGFTAGGIVAKRHVEPGQPVKAGDVLIELNVDERQALVDLYTVRANSDLPVRAAEANLKLAKVELVAITKAFEKGAATKIEVDRAEAQVAVKTTELDQAKQGVVEAKLELQRAVVLRDQYILKAPLDGVIEFVSVSEGELVEDQKPVLRLVVTDPVWVDAAVPTNETLAMKVGDPAWVTPHLTGKDKPVQGKIIHMATVADASSDTRLVRIELKNTAALPAGVHVTASFVPPTNLAVSASSNDDTKATTLSTATATREK